MEYSLDILTLRCLFSSSSVKSLAFFFPLEVTRSRWRRKTADLLLLLTRAATHPTAASRALHCPFRGQRPEDSQSVVPLAAIGDPAEGHLAGAAHKGIILYELIE